MTNTRQPFSYPEPAKRGTKWRVRWVDARGKRQLKAFSELAEAPIFGIERGLEAERRRVGLGEAPLSDAASRSFREVAERWLQDVAFEKRSLKSDESFLRAHLLPALGDEPIGSIDTGRVAAFRKSQERKVTQRGGQPLTPSTVHHHLTLLCTIMRYAHREGWIERIPVIRKPKLRRSEPRFLQTQEDVANFLAAARAQGELLYMLYAIPVNMGLRCGEVCGLRVEQTSSGSERLPALGDVEQAGEAVHGSTAIPGGHHLPEQALFAQAGEQAPGGGVGDLAVGDGVRGLEDGPTEGPVQGVDAGIGSGSTRRSSASAPRRGRRRSRANVVGSG